MDKFVIKNKSVLLLMILCILSLVMAFFSLRECFSCKTKEFVPPEFSVDALIGIPTVDEELGWSEVDAKVFKVSICGEIIIQGERFSVYFTNPKDNNVWLKLRLLNEDNEVIGETGLIKPGEYIETMGFFQCPKDGDLIKMKIMAYEPKTYYSEGSIVLETIAHLY